MGHLDPALEHQLLHVAKAQAEAKYSHTQWQMTSIRKRQP